ncbi:hypothetical protein SESBI_22438 [Sesbania bispinosa]|nr:hypothetical protein SESBI_22438 [Sesbania bispinosa]
MKRHTDTRLLPLPNVADITCMDASRPPGKVWKTVRFVIQNGEWKSKVMQDMQEVMKRGKSIGKALNNVMVRHHEALTCRPRDAHMSFVSPIEYQFSCSGSPPRPSRALSSRRKLSPVTTVYGRRHQQRDSPAVMRMCRGGTDNEVLVGRRVKITGSAAGSMLKDREEEEEFHVDQAAEEFIEKFYRELRLQKWLDHYC